MMPNFVVTTIRMAASNAKKPNSMADRRRPERGSGIALEWLPDLTPPLVQVAQVVVL
jgi:hypothetical protein